MVRTHRYPSDLTDAEWALVEAVLPPVSKDGRPGAHSRRDIVDAILYVTHNGIVWRALPAGFPPWQTVYGFFDRWKKKGVTAGIHDALRGRVRLARGREAEPTAGVVDSQSVKGAQTVGADSGGYDAGEKVNGRKRFVIVDTLGLLLTVLVVPANVQDRDGGRRLLIDHYFTHHRCRHLFADGGFAGQPVAWARTIMRTTVEIVRKKPGQKTFEALPKRWVVERTLVWLTAHRRLAHDYERHPATSASFIH
ncbi:IS5 family transposase [Frankia casuarinae]|uniref:Transposase, IS4 family n=1 Tax=Frankia casuarinae (strain DSM 45818 / CECT 9043 / HFP020203 / CcI3) TaxID=106370 RepID=Q2JGP7_FRACC|nr:transposase, IS4 family [Frankia casuarinae]